MSSTSAGTVSIRSQGSDHEQNTNTLTQLDPSSSHGTTDRTIQLVSSFLDQSPNQVTSLVSDDWHSKLTTIYNKTLDGTTDRTIQQAPSILDPSASALETNHFNSLTPDDWDSKSNHDQSLIRHLRHKLWRQNHSHSHHRLKHSQLPRRVPIGTRNSYKDSYKDTLKSDVDTINQMHNNDNNMVSRRNHRKHS